MKKMRLYFIFTLWLITSVLLSACVSSGSASTSDLQGTITILGAWAHYPMKVRWGEEFQTLHPDVRIDISAGGAVSGTVDIGMVSQGRVVPASGWALERGQRSLARSGLWTFNWSAAAPVSDARPGGRAGSFVLRRTTSALDPISAQRIEEQLKLLSTEATVVIVSYSQCQSRRLADHIIFL